MSYTCGYQMLECLGVLLVNRQIGNKDEMNAMGELNLFVECRSHVLNLHNIGFTSAFWISFC